VPSIPLAEPLRLALLTRLPSEDHAEAATWELVAEVEVSERLEDFEDFASPSLAPPEQDELEDVSEG